MRYEHNKYIITYKYKVTTIVDRQIKIITPFTIFINTKERRYRWSTVAKISTVYFFGTIIIRCTNK